MGNTLPAIQEETQPLQVVKATRKSIREKIKVLATTNVRALLAKKAQRFHPRFHLRLSLPTNNNSLQTMLNFLHKNRTRISSLKKISVFLDVREIIPLLLTTVAIRPLIKTLGQRLSRLRNLEAAEIGSSHLDVFCIEETLIESLTKMKKITSLSLGVPDNQKKINFIAKKLINLKRITRLTLNFSVQNANIKPILNNLKCFLNLKILQVSLASCAVNSEIISKLAETIKKMRKLEYLIIHLEDTTVQDADVELLYEEIEEHPRMEYFKIYMDGCKNLSWWLRTKIYAKENFGEPTNRC